MGFRNTKAEKNPYAKKRKRTIIISVLLVAVLLMIPVFRYLIVNQEKPLMSNFTVCDLSQEEVIETFKDHTYKEKTVIKDYFFYGESLSLFNESYNISNPDALIGKTLLLTNLCTEEEFHYLIDYDVDGQIPLENLPKGLYEVFINIDMVKKRVVMSEEIFETIHLVNRGEDHRKVEIIGSRNTFDDSKHKDYLDDNYLFINVEAMDQASDDYDIVIDPAHGTNASGFFQDHGKTVLGMVEGDELYSLAELIKEDLEAAGLKVLITRDNSDHIINQYGVDGRFDKAYQSKAKYYVELGFGDTDNGALKIYKSSYASQAFSSYIANHLLDELNLTKYGTNSVVSANRFNDLDGVISIRETGGKALAAATYSDLAEEQNKSFAYLNNFALETISIEYFSFTNEQELEHYKTNKEKYAEETAKAILEYFKLGEKEVEDDLSD